MVFNEYTSSMRFFTIFLTFFAHYCYAQPFKTDTTFFNNAKRNVISLYEDQVRTQSYLINGGSYNKVQLLHNDLSRIDEAHPYYVFEWMSGSVLYDGEHYNASFLYDLSTDNLIMQIVSLQKQILLIREKVDQFTLGEHRFMKLSRTSSFDSGFHELVYDGQTKVFIRKNKKMERVVGYDVEFPFKYVSKTTYYIKKNDRYYLVKSKRSVLKALSGKESVLRAFIRSQPQSFKENRAFFIREMARLYDQSPTEK